MNDERFLRKEKVPMTKEEVRSLSLSYLELHTAKRLLDIGAGSGSVILEALLTFPHLQGTAIEMKEDALMLITKNVDHFENQGSTIKNRLDLILGKAPFDTNDKWDRVFIGGTAGNVGNIINWCAEHMETDGIVVMNFVTLENFFHAFEYLKGNSQFKELRGGQMAFHRLDTLAKYHVLKGINPIFLLVFKKS